MPYFHTPMGDTALFRKEDMNPIFASLDLAISMQKSVIVHSDGDIAYDSATGSLSWASTLRIIFTTAAGILVENIVAAGSIVVAAGQMAYVDLSTTNGTVLTAAVASLTIGAASTTIAASRLVLGFRNATSNKFYPAALRFPITEAAGDMLKSVYDTDEDGKVDAAENADIVPWSGVSDKPQNVKDLADLVVSLANAGKVILVNEAGTAFVLGTITGGVSAFTDLSDVPANYTGAGGKIVAVKADASGLEFVALGSSTTLAGLGDVAITSIQDGQSIKWNAASSKFINYTPSSGGGGSASFASVATIASMMGGY